MGNVTKLPQPAQKVPLPVPRPANLTSAPATTKTAPADAKPVVSQGQPQVQTQIQDISQVNLQKGSATASLSLVDEHPAPPALLKNGDLGDTAAELNKLLKRTGMVKHASNIYSADTENAVKAFQKDNNLPVTGSVDALTLRKLIESTKMDEANFPKLEALLGAKPPAAPATHPAVPATGGTAHPVKPATPPAPTAQPAQPTAPVAPAKVYANDNERVKDLVAGQIGERGFGSEHAFAVGGSLREAATRWDKKMPSSSMCYTAVKRAIDDAIKVPYQVFGGKAHPNGSWAKTAGTNLLSKAPEFVKIEGLQRSDLTHLPAGAVIVYKPAKGPGHIGVQDGNGHDISDKTRNQANVYRTAPFEVYYPVNVRGEDPVTRPDGDATLATEPSTLVS